MADYYTLTQLALKLAISEAQIGELELEGFLHPILKDGRRFFSSSQAHDTQVALRLARKRRITLEQAFARVEDLRVYQTGSIKR